jgi:hypothetical protein
MPALKFRVLFDSVKEEEVFRDIAINEGLTFEQFYMSILDAFELPNDQMASFFVSDSDWNKGEEISLMDMSFGVADDETPTQMSEIMIREKITSPSQRLILVHDFLNMFIFLIELQEILNEDVNDAELVLSVGKVPQKLNEQTVKNLDKMRFETEIDEDLSSFDYDDFDDEFGGENFENIDDFDI